jgi:hypothetical protein
MHLVALALLNMYQLFGCSERWILIATIKDKNPRLAVGLLSELGTFAVADAI